MNKSQIINLVTIAIMGSAGALLNKYGVTADNVAGIVTGLASVGAIIWGIVAHNLHATTPEAKSAANNVTKTGTGLIILAIAGLAVFGSGCASAPTNIYKTVGTTDATVTAAVKAWDIYVSQNSVPIPQQLAVRAAFAKVQAAELLVLDADAAYAMYGTTNAPVGIVQQTAAAGQALQQAVTDLTNLLATFGVKI